MDDMPENRKGPVLGEMPHSSGQQKRKMVSAWKGLKAVGQYSSPTPMICSPFLKHGL
jgi:hypothetical protein